ncbi:hypothetical protein L915_20347 [Phytophthora nicotianae]|uniref:Uncharacterized protein n=1 Tax=Phytophthora nicotianae TaxID=4792 RepID=W2FPH1_PHYNI|nr:hypothetical protein L915_20347 [Phytophthora nicotianae]
MFKCSAPYEASKNTEEGPVIKRLRQLETLLLETKAQITELKNLQSQAGLTDQSVARLPAINVTDEAAASNLETQLRSQTNGLDIPSVKDWAHLWLLWWLPHEKVHLFKPLSEWPQSDRARAGITRSWYSMAKLLGEDLAMFANMMGESDKCRWHKTVLPLFSSYYVKYYGGAGSADRDTTFTISMLASFIRKDRKGRRNSACRAKPLPDYSSYL